jgi:cytochrome c biogenesis protein CcdA
MTFTHLVIAFLAGGLSILSPCVVPILPIVFAGAASHHRRGPAALALGLSVSFVSIGLFIATVGHAIALDGDVFRFVAAALITAIGAVLLSPALQTRLVLASGPITNWAERRSGSLQEIGLLGQFGIGVLMGAVWSPCVGPTLGAASLLAAQGRDLPQVAITMFAFGVGASIVLLVLGVVSRHAMLRWRHRILVASQGARAALGFGLVTIGALVLTHADKIVETALVKVSPQWLTDLTTRF